MLARCGRWHPKHDGFHAEWHAMQLMLSLVCPHFSFGSVGRSPHTIFPSLSNRTVFARADLALYRGCLSSMVSLVCTISHCNPFSTHEFWKYRRVPFGPSRISNRGVPNGVFRANRLRPWPSAADV